MKRIKFVVFLLIAMLIFTSCESVTGVGEAGEGANPGQENVSKNDSSKDKTDYSTPYGKDAGLYNSKTGALKYSWAELEARGYITVKETVITKSAKYIRGDLYIPNSISAIGSGAFANCTGLTKVYVGNGITTIDTKAFYGCTGLELVELGNNITNISSNAFANCTKFKEIKIPDSVTNIGSSAFSGCTGLINLSIGDGVTNISQSAFNNCTGLDFVQIGKNVTYIGAKAFNNCKVLSSVSFNGTKAAWSLINVAKNNTDFQSARIQAIDGVVGEATDTDSSNNS